MRKVTIDNRTDFDTRQLRTLVIRALDQMMSTEDKHVVFRYRRRNARMLGRATIGTLHGREGRRILVLLPLQLPTRGSAPPVPRRDHFPDDGAWRTAWHEWDRAHPERWVEVAVIGGEVLRDVANILLHEIGHTLGLRHKHLNGGCVDAIGRWATGDYSWLGDLTAIERRPAKPKLTIADIVSRRAEHARVMLAKAERKAKLARTIVARWKRKVSHYDRKLAAGRAPA